MPADHHNSAEKLHQLLKIMQTLRSPTGCPWDAEQTPQSLAPYIQEEACELIDAIASGNTEAIKDELGDLLLQIVFQAQIFHEMGLFCFADVAETISSKMIRRHPHVFTSNDRNLCHAELSEQWNTIKSSERAESGQEQGPLAHIPVSLPALQRAQKTLSRIEQADLQSKLPDLDGIHETLDEEQLGQALFNLVRRAEASGLDAEGSLRKTICCLISDFQATEEKVS